MGCGAGRRAPTSAPGTQAPATVAATEPPATAKSQSAIVDLANTFFTINPLLSTEIGGITVGNAVFSRVCAFTPDGKIMPELLEALPEMEDSSTWVLKFIKGVKFHDGTELKASDFKFSIDWMLNGDNASTFGAS